MFPLAVVSSHVMPSTAAISLRTAAMSSASCFFAAARASSVAVACSSTAATRATAAVSFSSTASALSAAAASARVASAWIAVRTAPSVASFVPVGSAAISLASGSPSFSVLLVALHCGTLSSVVVAGATVSPAPSAALSCAIVQRFAVPPCTTKSVSLVVTAFAAVSSATYAAKRPWTHAPKSVAVTFLFASPTPRSR